MKVFVATNYHVRCFPPMTLRINVSKESLVAFHKFHGVESSVCMTACNQFSQAFNNLANDESQRMLAREFQ